MLLNKVLYSFLFFVYLSINFRALFLSSTKISNRDKSIYKTLTKDSILTFEEAVECYRVITGACFFGTKNFIETHRVSIKDYSIEEIIELTSNQYGGNTFKEFFI